MSLVSSETRSDFFVIWQIMCESQKPVENSDVNDHFVCVQIIHSFENYFKKKDTMLLRASKDFPMIP